MRVLENHLARTHGMTLSVCRVSYLKAIEPRLGVVVAASDNLSGQVLSIPGMKECLICTYGHMGLRIGKPNVNIRKTDESN